MADEVAFRWGVPVSDVAEQRRLLEEAGAKQVDEAEPGKDELGEEYGHAAFEPVTMIIGVVSVVALARQILRFVNDARRSGFVIDTRGGELRILPEASLDRQTIVVVEDDGTKLLEPARHEELADLLTAALKHVT